MNHQCFSVAYLVTTVNDVTGCITTAAVCYEIENLTDIVHLLICSESMLFLLQIPSAD